MLKEMSDVNAARRSVPNPAMRAALGRLSHSFN
jgi:hypothetical protein